MTRREALATTLAAALPSVLAAPAQAAVAPLAFDGYNWVPKDSGGGTVGPGPNLFDPANVAVVNGKLHLRVARNAANQLACAEVTMAPPQNQTLGYGTYRFTVNTPADALPESVTLGLFTWSDTKQQNLGEIDVELARWGNAGSVTNAQFVVQPFDATDGRLVRFTQPPPPPNRGLPTVFEFDWRPTGVRFRASTVAGQLLSLWYFSGPDLPKSSDERVHMNLWVYDPANATVADPVEVVISKFEFIKAA